MFSQNISQELKTFVKEQIHSVFSLGVLLLLHRAHNRSFSPEEIAEELGVEVDVSQQLSELTTANLVAITSADVLKYHYAPANKELASMVDQLAVAYAEKRVPILSLILAEHPDRIRSFAEAFRLIGD
jgi:DNA-binding transcriptional regulator GbsR (MarR family)